MYKLRLLEVVSGLGLGGAERALITRMKYCPVNFEQTVLNIRPEVDSLILDASIKHHRITKKGISRLIAIHGFLCENTFDAIIVRTPVDAIRFGVLKFIKFRHSPKLIFEAHSNFVSKKFGMNFILTYLLHAVFGKINLIVAVSQNVAIGPLCRGHGNVHVVMLGAELGNLLKSTTTPEITRLIFIGRLIPLKRPVWLLERLSAIQCKRPLPPGTLTILGSGPLKKDVEEFIAANNLKDVANCAGEQLDITPFLMSATHLVSCSTNEGLPLTFFEAKLAGLAIISTPSGGGNEIFDAWDRELLTFDEKEFEQVLIETIGNPPPSVNERRAIQEASSWMRASLCATKFYSLLSEQLLR